MGLIGRLLDRVRAGLPPVRSAQRGLRALADLVDATGTAEGEDRLIETVSGWVSGALQPAGCAVLVSDADGRLRVRARAGALLDGPADDGAPPATLEVLRRGRVVRVAGGAASGLYVPLLSGGHPVGVLHLTDGERPAAWWAREWFLARLGRVVGSALDRERLRAEAAEAEVVRRAGDLKSLLLATASHELRTPLAVVEAAATGLMQAGVASQPETTEALAGAIHREVRHLGALVADLLDLARAEAGVLRLNVAWYDVGELVREAVDRLPPESFGSPARAAVEVEGEAPPTRLDYVLLDRVVANLVQNARRYATPERPVRVAVRAEGGRVRVTVADDGPGIPPQHLERVFEPFRRLEAGGTGTGLGLAICRAIVEAHGGRIWAESPLHDGRGTAVHFTLPITHPEPEALPADPP
ncbi:MAG TPA: ATP-binding protein [Chloroflexota bacterium]|nr:ATP-binding protein [Chloroflexota bacterium]